MKNTTETKHSPGPWKQLNKAEGRLNDIVLRADNGGDECRICTVHNDPEHSDQEVEANARLIASAPQLVEALQGLLAQLQGPVMVHGDGIGNDGKKTGLSGDEFNALRDNRIAQARALLAAIKDVK